LLMAGERAVNCTAYVSLEPCNHFGRTGPCTRALLSHGIKRVVSGMVDPDPRVSGSGLQFLADNGVEVSCGVEADLCLQTNAPFIHRILHKCPLCIVAMPVSTSMDTGLLDASFSEAWNRAAGEWTALLRDVTVSEVDCVVLNADQSRTLLAAYKAGAGVVGDLDVDLVPRHVSVLSVLDDIAEGDELQAALQEVRYIRQRYFDIALIAHFKGRQKSSSR
jgi:hypothetical protein